MISYLIFSSVSMGILLLYYHVMLEKEKFHQINRVYLIVSLIFSLAIPLIPVRFAITTLPWSRGFFVTRVQSLHILSVFTGIIHPATKSGGSMISQPTRPVVLSFQSFAQLVPIIYMTIVIFLFFRLTRIIEIIQMKTRKSPLHFFEHYPVVLLNEKTVPFTFLNTIFVNKGQYQTGLIDRAVLVHELTHAKQKHTLDILFVELLKIVFWFNPILYFYKKAMMLNHEFIADKAAISTGTSVADYQTLLLDEIMPRPIIGLTSSFSHSMTIKRFRMMSDTTSGRVHFLRLAALLPLFVFLCLLVGCKPTPLGHKAVSNKFTIELIGSNRIKLNGQEMSFPEFKQTLSHVPEKSATDFSLHIRPNATMGMVWDVQHLMERHSHPNFFKSNSPRVVAKIDLSGKNVIKLDGARVTHQELDNKLVRILKSDHNLLIHFDTTGDVPLNLIVSIQNLIWKNQNGVVMIDNSSM